MQWVRTPPLAGKDLEAFREGLAEVCQELAKAIPADGEGATHLVTSARLAAGDLQGVGTLVTRKTVN